MQRAISAAVLSATLAVFSSLAQAQPSETPPTDSTTLLKWLRAGSYKAWPKESAPHRSMGPHQTLVVAYLNPLLDKSMTAKSASHPQGAAAVKELFDADGKPYGWAVAVKTSHDSDGGKGWYWYEILGGATANVVAQASGVAVCVGCHARGRDFVLIPHPLD